MFVRKLLSPFNGGLYDIMGISYPSHAHVMSPNVNDTRYILRHFTYDSVHLVLALVCLLKTYLENLD